MIYFFFLSLSFLKKFIIKQMELNAMQIKSSQTLGMNKTLSAVY